MSFERRPAIEQILREFRIFRRPVIARVLDDSLAHLEREIQPAKRSVTQLEIFNDA